MKTWVSSASALLATTAIFAAWSSSHLRAQDSAEGPKRPIIAIENVALVDVVRGEMAKPRTVLIDNGRIAAIGEPDAIDIPPATGASRGWGPLSHAGTGGHTRSLYSTTLRDRAA